MVINGSRNGSICIVWELILCNLIGLFVIICVANYSSVESFHGRERERERKLMRILVCY